MRVSLEEFSAVIASIHSAAASPERWPEALSAVARLVDGREKSCAEIRECGPGIKPDAAARDRRLNQAREVSGQRIMALITAHLEAARQLQSKLAESFPGWLALASLDRWAAAAFVVDGAGTVHYRNASAKALLASGCCVRVINLRIRFNEHGLNRAFEAALSRAIQSSPRSSILPLPSPGKEIFELTVSPLTSDYGHPVARTLPLALVVIATLQADAECIIQRVRPLYGLTEAEARVMAALALGATVEEIAPAHGVRTSTIRAQVRSIFEKTGVNRQSDLVRLALSGASLISLISGPER